MQNEKLAAILLVIVIVGSISVFLTVTYGEDILNALSGKKTGEKTEGVEVGDCVDVNYIGSFEINGTVFDTSYENVSKQWGLYNKNLTYEPLKIFVNPNGDLQPPAGYEENYSSSMISGFLKGLIGMKKGEKKIVTMLPEDAYGDWNITMMKELFEYYYGLPYYPRFTNYSTNTTLPKQYLTNYAQEVNLSNLSVNQTFTYLNGTSQAGKKVTWQIKIINITDENVTIKHLVENGTIINGVLWNSTIIVDNETSFRERADPVVGFTLTEGTYPYVQHLKIVDFNETAIIMATNIEAPKISFIGQTLIFELEVVNLYKTSQIES